MKDVAARIKEQSTASKKVVNSADLFATSVAAEIRKISERMRCMVKNKMNKVFKHQTMMRNPIQMLTPSPENSFQIFNQQPSFQVPTATFPNVQSPSVPSLNTSSSVHSSRETDYDIYSPTH